MKTLKNKGIKKERLKGGLYKISDKTKKRVDKYYENYGKSDNKGV